MSLAERGHSVLPPQSAVHSPDDTIAAIATAPGEGGIGIVRLSGAEARAILGHLFRPANSGAALESHRLVYGHIVEPEGARVVDEVLVAFMRAPHTYTREDLVEINAHGGPLVLRRILDLTIAAGARAAGPGEFTLRAFLNGRIDLAQAEAVMDLVAAQTDAQLRHAAESLGGRLSDAIRAVRADILDVMAYLTARIDFPEDDVPMADVAPQLAGATARLDALLADADAGIVLRRGLRVALVGCPNVGKSSLLNALLRQDRAIVTPIPGTTRDTLEESASLAGLPFVLVDTAGFNEAPDAVERLGIERSAAALEAADVVLLVLDASRPLGDGDRDLLARLCVGHTPGRALLVANKCDLPAALDPSALPAAPLATSAVTGAGIAELEARLVEIALGGRAPGADSFLVTSPRHKDALARAATHLAAARAGLATGLPEDFLTIDLEAALRALGEITGESVGEDLLDAIFSRFCIGK
jgi:tRNA modification GTPase